MAFIKINGWQVGILFGSAGFRVREVGGREFAYDATPLITRSGWKRRWRFVSEQLDNRDAEGLIGTLCGRGWHWQYDSPWASDNATVGTKFWDTRGLEPTGSVSATVVPGYDLQSVYPARVYEESSGEPESKFGGGALKVEPATENELAADIRDCEDYTAFGSLTSATLSDEATIKLQGTQSVKTITTAAVGSGIRSGFFTLDATTEYTFSCYVYATSALNLQLEIHDGAGQVATTAFSATANAWTRVEVTGTTSGSPTSGGRVALYTTDASVVTYYTDMWQLEESDYATAWADGTRAAGVLRYDLNPIPRALTVAMWAKAPSANPTNTSYLWILRGATTAGNSFVYCRRQAATNNIQFAWDPPDGAGDSISYGTNPWDGDWHHVACVYMPNDGGTEAFYLYFDGTLVASETSPVSVPKLFKDNSNRFFPGSQAGAQHWIGAMDEILVLPFPMGADQIAALANRTTGLPAYPRLELTGDWNYNHLESQGVEAQKIGEVKSQYIGVVDNGTYKGYMRKVGFELQSKKDI